MVENNHKNKILLSEVENTKSMAASVQLSGIESRDINRDLETSDYEEETVNPCYGNLHRAADKILTILGAVSPLIDDMVLYKQLSVSLVFGNFHASIGSTYSPDKEYLMDEDTLSTNPNTDVTDDE